MAEKGREPCTLREEKTQHSNPRSHCKNSQAEYNPAEGGRDRKEQDTKTKKEKAMKEKSNHTEKIINHPAL